MADVIHERKVRETNGDRSASTALVVLGIIVLAVLLWWLFLRSGTPQPSQQDQTQIEITTPPVTPTPTEPPPAQ